MSMNAREKIAMVPGGAVRGTIRPPGSKSITNRALVCAALAEGSSTLTGALDSEDTQVMIQALRQLGLAISYNPAAATLEIAGCGGILPRAGADLYVANSGTTMRFLAALVALGRGPFRLDGTPRMRERPIADLVEALRQLLVTVRTEQANGCPPVLIEANGLRGGRAEIAGNISSQFLSGLLLAAPGAAAPIELVVTGPLVSKPYIQMTLDVMRSFGVDVQSPDLRQFNVAAPLKYHRRTYAVEPDASAASYFFAAAAITGGRITVEGLSRMSLQGDVAFCDCLEQMGCCVEYAADSITVSSGLLRGIDVDMNAISDTVQTLAAVALFAEGPTIVRGVGHIRHKETDRLHALAVELRKLGADVDERSDGLQIVPRPLHAAEIDTYDDHRMAMSLALVGLKVPGVVIRDPDCTRKTYPEYFADLESLRKQAEA
jgi:3-phosphoshikimate 1-carboxyvinyltransferase